eukprot:5337877-Pyramimonas_sp.AAC.2
MPLTHDALKYYHAKQTTGSQRWSRVSESSVRFSNNHAQRTLRYALGCVVSAKITRSLDEDSGLPCQHRFVCSQLHNLNPFPKQSVHKVDIQ